MPNQQMPRFQMPESQNLATLSVETTLFTRNGLTVFYYQNNVTLRCWRSKSAVHLRVARFVDKYLYERIIKVIIFFYYKNWIYWIVLYTYFPLMSDFGCPRRLIWVGWNARELLSCFVITFRAASFFFRVASLFRLKNPILFLWKIHCYVQLWKQSDLRSVHSH